jgi:hypothetical protein
MKVSASPVIPSKEGIHNAAGINLTGLPHFLPASLWISAFAEMTGEAQR